MAVMMPTEDFPFLPSGLAEVNKMITEYGDMFSDSQCKVCSAVLISESQKLTHYQSKKHANKVRRYLSIKNATEPSSKKFKSSPDSDVANGDTTERSKVCHVCNTTFSSVVVAESHYKGKVHAKSLRLKTLGPSTQAQPPVAALPLKKKGEEPAGGVATAVSLGPAEDDPDRFCSICKASFNNPIMAQQHYAGKKHKKQLTKRKLMETYGPATTPAVTVKGFCCVVCCIELNSVEQYQAHISGSKHKNQVKRSGHTALLSPSESHFPSGDDFAGVTEFGRAEQNSEWMEESDDPLYRNQGQPLPSDPASFSYQDLEFNKD